MAGARIWRELGNRWLAARLAVSGRVHQYPEILALRRFLSSFSVDVVFDVGANYGQYAQMLRHDVGYCGHIFSFEPNPDVFSALSKTAAGDGKWHVFNMALSDFDGTVPFHIMAAHQFSSIEQPAAQMDAIFNDRNRIERTVDMQCRRLDGMIDELLGPQGLNRPFLKMDTQGHDRAVCEGATASLARVLGVQSELAVQPLYAGATEYRDMIAYLEAKGFVPNALFANNKGHFPRLVEMDGVFIRSDLARAIA
ncbi:MAG: FkbM family methyltransferase [Sphingobium sp.]